jgi:hypothetical protein
VRSASFKGHYPSLILVQFASNQIRVLTAACPRLQFTLGWDWIQGTPDRNTGLWDKVWVESTGPLTVRDPFLRTLSVTAPLGAARHCAAALRYTAQVRLPSFIETGSDTWY